MLYIVIRDYQTNLIFSASKEEIARMSGKHLVETEDIANEAIKKGVFKKGDYVCLQGQMHRIIAPLDAEKATAVIFYTKNTKTDDFPNGSKIVSNFDTLYLEI